MRLTSSRAYTRAVSVPKMPHGLVELMEGLTKDVLKNNPSNVYEFCANHLEKLLEIRDGPSCKKSLTLEEKIAKAQEKVRQRAKERQQLYDREVQSSVRRDALENVDTDQNSTEQELVPNLRAPVHHDQELSPSSEVEISHELTDNSLTSRDSNFDESDEVLISKSSTFSSVSKSTVIDLTTGNDYETNSKDDTLDDGLQNIENPKIEINNDNQVKGGEIVDVQKDEIDVDKNIETSKSEIINDEPMSETEILDDQNAKMTEDKNSEQSFDNKDKKQELIESLNTDYSNQPVAKEESNSAVIIISDEANPVKEVDNLIKVQPDIIVKSDIESEHELHLKSINEGDAVIEVDLTNQIEPRQAEDIPDLSVEVAKHDDEKSSLKTTDNKITIVYSNEIVSTDNVADEKSILNQVTDIDITSKMNASESLKETAQLKSVLDNANAFTNNLNMVDSPIKDLDPDESSVQIDETNHGLQVSDVKVDDEKITPAESLKKNNEDVESKSEEAHDAAHEIKEVFENSVISNSTADVTNNIQFMFHLKNNHETNNDLEEKHNIIYAKTENNVNKEDNAISNSISLQTPSSSENNDDSVIGSDSSKAEDDIPRSDNESGQNNMNLETAAVTIQKVFRSFLFKSRNSTFEDITNDDALEEDNDKNKEAYYATANLNKERRPLGITRMDTVLQTVNEEKSLSLSTDDSSTISSAATTIQAHVRGFLVRNKLNSYKTVSTNSLVNSNELLDTDAEQNKNKTVLNIHIVPEEGNYLSRDESLITSMELSLDGSPPSSVNLHPLSYDLVSERRKLLKREDAIQSVSPPSNNSGKLSEDSVKEVIVNDKTEGNIHEKDQLSPENNSPETLVTAVAASVVHNTSEQEDSEITTERHKRSMSSDESDVITPFASSPRSLVGDENTSKLIHSGEFHDVVLPTKVSRSDTTVVREFKNVLVYILLWNNS